jgi:hypothetical protein
MSPKGRPEGEYRSAEHEGNPMSAQGRPKRDTPRSEDAKRGG